MILRFLHSRPVKRIPCDAVINITLKLSSLAHKEPVLNSVGGCAKVHSLVFNALFKLSKIINLWSHIVSIPLGKLRFVHLEAIVMFCYRHNISCSSLLKQLCPLISIKLLSLKHRDEVLIAKVLLWSISFNMMLVLS